MTDISGGTYVPEAIRYPSRHFFGAAMIRYSDQPSSFPARSSRLLAAACYLVGSLALIVVALGPRNPFLVRHAQYAMILHVTRLALVTGALLIWYQTSGDSEISVATYSLHIATLILIGLPWPGDLEAQLLVMLGLPLGTPWMLSMAGAMIGASGMSIDPRAALNTRWPDVLPENPKIGTLEYDRSIGLRGGRPEYFDDLEGESTIADVERRIARELRDGRLERMWSASRVAAQERNRSEIMLELEKRQETVLVRLDHLNHLLSNGAISMSRFNRFNLQLIEYLEALRLVRAQLRSRLDGTGRAFGELPPSPDALSEPPEAEAITMAVINQSGMPVVSYGHFTLDESLISGMVSVMDGLSEEMFGSRANMTHLDDGEVVYFAQGEHCSVFVTFDDEPSPLQVARLREFRDEFELSNSEELQLGAFDPANIVEIDVPFQFARLHPSGHSR